MDPFTAALIASVVGGGISAIGGVAGANAQANAAKDSAQVQKDIYEDQAARNEPWRQAGLNALNFQNQWLGLPSVSNGSGGFGGSSRLVGSQDQWMAYLQAYPELQQEWARLTTQSKNPFKTPAEYAQWHYNTYGPNGENQGWQLPDMGNEQSTQPVGGSQQVASTDIWDSIKNNPLWKSATEGFIMLDTPEVNAAFATGGKALSGAQKKALQDRSTARSYNALTDIYNQYGGISGTGYNATQATNQAASAMGSNVGNAMMARGNAQASGYAGLGNAASAFADSYFRYGGGGGGSPGGTNYSSFKNGY